VFQLDDVLRFDSTEIINMFGGGVQVYRTLKSRMKH